ncbi:MAG: hypothetical protein ACXVXN_12375, partial [Mycobacteriaceae bacterium]
MAVLGNATPNMSIIYSTLSDPTVKQQYQDALDRHLGPEVILAGPAAGALREHLLDPKPCPGCRPTSSRPSSN